MPLSIIEAMAQGLPILALKTSELEDVVIDGKTGYLLPKDAKTISKKAAYLFKNSGILARLAMGAHNHALKFSVKIKSKELEKLYKTAIPKLHQDWPRKIFYDGEKRCSVKRAKKYYADIQYRPR